MKITAKRAGWTGCNILLNEIPTSGKIFLIKNRQIQKKETVLNTWEKTTFLSKQKEETKKWLIEIMILVDRFKDLEFQLIELYKYEDYLKTKFPRNNFIKDKIRQ